MYGYRFYIHISVYNGGDFINKRKEISGSSCRRDVSFQLYRYEVPGDKGKRVNPLECDF